LGRIEESYLHYLIGAIYTGSSWRMRNARLSLAADDDDDDLPFVFPPQTRTRTKTSESDLTEFRFI